MTCQAENDHKVLFYNALSSPNGLSGVLSETSVQGIGCQFIKNLWQPIWITENPDVIRAFDIALDVLRPKDGASVFEQRAK